MLFIRQGATHKVVIGPAVAVADGYTPVTTLDVATSDEAEVILHDNGTVVDISGYTWAAIATADGYYHLTLAGGISNTVGHMTVVINDDSLCLPLRADFTVVDTEPYDDLLADAAVGYLKSTVAGRDLDVSAGGEAGVDWANVGTPGSTVDLSATTIDLCDQVTANDDMRGTDNAALASVVGALADAAAAGDPTSADTVMQYAKQLVNLLAGTDGIGTMPAGANPANAVNLFEMVRGGLGATFDTATDSQEAARNKLTDIETDTGQIGTAGVGLSDLGGMSTAMKAEVNAEADTALTDYDAATGTEMATAQSDLDTLTGSDGATLATAQGNYAPNKVVPDAAGTASTLHTATDADIATAQTDLDTLTDAAGEPAQGAPPVSASMVDKVAWMYKTLRNKKTQTATVWSLYNDAGAVVDSKATVSDDATTATKGEIGTGP